MLRHPGEGDLCSWNAARCRNGGDFADDASIGVDRRGVQLASILVRLDARRLGAPFAGQSPPCKRAPGKDADSGVGAERHHLSIFLALEPSIVILHGDETRPSVLAGSVHRLAALS